jgi:hypothetical protein
MTLFIDRPNNDVFLWFQSSDVSSANTGFLSHAFPAPCNGNIVAFMGALASSINNNTAMILSTTQSGLNASTPITNGGTLTLLSVGSSVAGAVTRNECSGVTTKVSEGDTIKVWSSQTSSNASAANFCIVIRK